VNSRFSPNFSPARAGSSSSMSADAYGKISFKSRGLEQTALNRPSARGDLDGNGGNLSFRRGAGGPIKSAAAEGEELHKRGKEGGWLMFDSAPKQTRLLRKCLSATTSYVTENKKGSMWGKREALWEVQGKSYWRRK